MQFHSRFRSLHFRVLFGLIIPFTAILTAALVTIIYTFQNSMTQLVLERHQQLANLAAVTVSQGIEGDSHVLEALRSRASSRGLSGEVPEDVFRQSAEALVDFTAGVIQVNASGEMIAATPNLPLEKWDGLPESDLYRRLSTARNPVFSGVVTLQNGEKAILIAVPIIDEAGIFSGAVIGGINISQPGNSIDTSIQKLTASTPGIACLIDGQGIVISHPNPAEIGKNYKDRFTSGRAIHGSRGGSLWKSPEGEWFVGAEAPVSLSGWNVVINEPWDTITGPARRSAYMILIFVLLALALFIFLSWAGTRQVTEPIQKLSKNTLLLASGEAVPAIEETQIKEIDDLGSAFSRMAMQISSYRDGLRHYVEALTRSQEEERLRIARELHDETVQNLLAVYRRMELFGALETDPQKRQQFSALHDMIGQTLQGVRLISQDLRPMMLDDLGFVPAVQMLVRKAHEGPGAVPDVSVEVSGEIRPLPAGVELALYRVVQEALNNVRKHARATSVRVVIDYQPDSVRLEIVDDGVGFSVPSSFAELVRSGNLGLMGIQERVWAAGGKLNVESKIGKGTVITIHLPLS